MSCFCNLSQPLPLLQQLTSYSAYTAIMGGDSKLDMSLEALIKKAQHSDRKKGKAVGKPGGSGGQAGGQKKAGQQQVGQQKKLQKPGIKVKLQQKQLGLKPRQGGVSKSPGGASAKVQWILHVCDIILLIRDSCLACEAPSDQRSTIWQQQRHPLSARLTAFPSCCRRSSVPGQLNSVGRLMRAQCHNCQGHNCQGHN